MHYRHFLGSKGTTECDKSTFICDFFFNKKFICDVGIANMIMKPSNARKDKVTTKCDKSKVTCDIGTIQCDNKTFKYEKIIIIIIRVQPNVTKT